MQNTIADQLEDLTFNQINDISYRLEFDSYQGSKRARLVVVFTNDDEWRGYIRSAYAFDSFNEDWDGEQPIAKWIERMERAYWDI